MLTTMKKKKKERDGPVFLRRLSCQPTPSPMLSSGDWGRRWLTLLDENRMASRWMRVEHRFARLNSREKKTSRVGMHSPSKETIIPDLF